MDKELLDKLKNMSEEERAAFFRENKDEFLVSEFAEVNGTIDSEKLENPDSEEVPYKGNWYSSFGYICNGIEAC